MSRRPLVWLFAALIGCSNSSEPNLTLPATSPDVIGTFALTNSDGVAPPFIAFTTATEQWRLQSDALVIAPDGTWSETTNYLVFQLSDGSSAIRSGGRVRIVRDCERADQLHDDRWRYGGLHRIGQRQCADRRVQRKAVRLYEVSGGILATPSSGNAKRGNRNRDSLVSSC